MVSELSIDVSPITDEYSPITHELKRYKVMIERPKKIFIASPFLSLNYSEFFWAENFRLRKGSHKFCLNQHNKLVTFFADILVNRSRPVSTSVWIRVDCCFFYKLIKLKLVYVYCLRLRSVNFNSKQYI